MNIKKLATIGLTLFAAVTLAKVTFELALTGERKGPAGRLSFVPKKGDFLMVYYMIMGKKRCKTCLQMEALTRKAMLLKFAPQISSGKVGFRIVNTEEPDNQWFKKEFSLPSTSVIVAKYKDGKLRSFKNLNRIWFLWNKEKEFIEYIEKEVREWMPGR